MFGLSHLPTDLRASPSMAFSAREWRTWQPTGSTDVNLQFDRAIHLDEGERHTMKFGADLRWLRWDDLGWAIQNGTYTFNGQYSGNGCGTIAGYTQLCSDCAARKALTATRCVRVSGR